MARTEKSPATRQPLNQASTPAGRRAAGRGNLTAALTAPVAPTWPATPGRRRKRQRARLVRRLSLALARLPKMAWLRPKGVRGAAAPWGAGTLIGLVLLALAVGVVGYTQSALRWFVYRETVQIQGLTYLDDEEIYTASGVDSWNIFWLRPDQIRERLLALPLVKAASVDLALPNRVIIQVSEEEPVALWVTNDGGLWLMPDGTALPMHDDRFSALPQLVDPNREAQDVTRPDQPAIDPVVLAGALALWTQGPEIAQLRFNRDYGLNFNLPGTTTWVYWGDGRDLEAKFDHLAAVEQLIEQGEATAQIVDVRFERPYIH
jgi:hypothetical protein